MAWTKMKTAIVIGVGILLAAGTTAITVKEIQDHKSYPWQVPRADFMVFYKMVPMVKIVPTKFAEDGGWCCNESIGAMGIAQPLKEIIQAAYQKDELRTVVVADLTTDKFDFFAKLVPPQEPHKDTPQVGKWAVELQKEITRKFGIKGNLETRETDVLVMKPNRTGVRGFKISHTIPPDGHALINSAGIMAGFEQPVSTLLKNLEQKFRMPIIDRTGLTERYDFALQWNEPDRKQPNLEGLKQALYDQLGLELVPTNMPIEMLVVERVK